MAGIRIGEDEVEILRKIEVLLQDDSGFEIANWNRGLFSNINRVESSGASEFEANTRHGGLMKKDDEGFRSYDATRKRQMDI